MINKININKKAQGSFSIFTFMITAFITVIFFAGLIWIMGTLNGVFTEIGLANEQAVHTTTFFPCIDNASNTCSMNTYVNLTRASEQIWGQAYDSIQALRMVAIVYILALGASIIIIGFLEKKHPFLFFVYILIGLLGIMFAPTISNAYETILGTGIFDGELVNFSASNFILLNLPIVVLVIFAIGGIGLFINLVRGDNTGEIR